MFYVKGSPIHAEEIEVLKELKKQLAEKGINRFNEFKVGSYNIQFNCPVHANGQEKNPSCGILIKDSNIKKIGIVHCFTCGYTAKLEQMISYCFGVNDLGYFGKKWLIKNFVVVQTEKREDIFLNLDRAEKKEKIQCEEDINKYRCYHPYMKQRKLNDDIIEKFEVGYDKETNCLTFPVKDKKGKILFIARRSVKGKFFHYPEEAQKPVYGLYEFEAYAERKERVVICESIINALTCWSYGIPAVALNGLGTEYQAEQLKQMDCRHFILGFDNDSAGVRASKLLREKLLGYKLISYYVLPKGKDINDLSKLEFLRLGEYL